MSYRCKECNKPQRRGSKPQTVVVEKRPQSYVNRVKIEDAPDHVIESTGWEIIKEIKVCIPCFKRLTVAPIV